ncbi:MAG: hypothetical protein AB9915_00395 [Candidatus Dojkabacteria bacterium]
MKVPSIKLSRKLLVITSSIIVLIVAGILISPQLTKLHDKYAIRQPLWEEFNKENTQPNFALTKIAFRLAPGDGKEGTNYFFRNRMTLNGSTTDQECYETQYKCGDGGWKDFKYGSILLANRCIVKVKPGTYCNVILPGGTLIAASNDNNKVDFANSLFHFYEKDLIFQIISTDEQITIKQSITKQESVLWHSLAPKFNKRYVVELGDQTMEATGTEFYTSTDEDLGAVTTVVKGSVKVSGTTIKKGQYAQIPYFNVVTCPPVLKACGNSCIPANGICCDTNSYCLSPVQCQENSTGTCKAKLFLGESSQYCCYNNPNANSFSLFEKGSYDCKDGYKFCANRCIPDDQECCYPTDNDCPVTVEDLDVGTGDVPSGYEFPRQYFFSLYDKILADPKYIKLISDPSFAKGEFNFDDVLDYISKYLKAIVEKDYAKSNEKEEQTTYCTNYPNSGACPSTKKSEDNSASISGDCKMMDGVTISWCYVEGIGIMVKNKPGYVQCWIKYDHETSCKSSGGLSCTGTGDAAIPKKCLPKGFSNWRN